MKTRTLTTIQCIDAGHDTNGNARRVWLITRHYEDGEANLGAWQENAGGQTVLERALREEAPSAPLVELPTVKTTWRQAKELLADYATAKLIHYGEPAAADS